MTVLRQHSKYYLEKFNHQIVFINKKNNKGKGSAVKSAIRVSSADLFAIQDADLEYNPKNISRLIKPIIDGDADVVYGSRYMMSVTNRDRLPGQDLGNKIITKLINMVIKTKLTDGKPELRFLHSKIAKQLYLKENRFNFEAEFTIKSVLLGSRLSEMPISYRARSYCEGKKITWLDGLSALAYITKFYINRNIEKL